jgi:hypothetical protein
MRQRRSDGGICFLKIDSACQRQLHSRINTDVPVTAVDRQPSLWFAESGIRRRQAKRRAASRSQKAQGNRHRRAERTTTTCTVTWTHGEGGGGRFGGALTLRHAMPFTAPSSVRTLRKIIAFATEHPFLLFFLSTTLNINNYFNACLNTRRISGTKLPAPIFSLLSIFPSTRRSRRQHFSSRHFFHTPSSGHQFPQQPHVPRRASVSSSLIPVNLFLVSSI